MSDERLGRLTRAERERYYKIIWWLRRNPVHAVWVLFGVTLSPHQRICFKQMWVSNSVGLKLSRGLSKTFLVGLYMVLKGLLYKGASQIVLTRGFRGGKLVLRESCQAVVSNTLDGQVSKFFALQCLDSYRRTSKGKYTKILQKDPDLWSLTFTHGSDIKTGPLGKDVSKSSQLRGLRSNATLVLDEAADIGDDLYSAVIRPFGRVAGNPVVGANKQNRTTLTKIEAGTIKYDWQRYTHELQHIEEEMRQGNVDFALLEFNYEDCFHWLNNQKPLGNPDIRDEIKKGNVIFTYRLNLEDVFDEVLNSSTSMEDFLSENKNQIQISSGTEFPSQLLESIVGSDIDPIYIDKVARDSESIMWDPDQNDRGLFPLLKSDDICVLGVDPARESDDAAFSLVRIGRYRKCNAPFNDLIHTKTLNRKTYQELYDTIRWYLTAFPNIQQIVMDIGGGGYALRDLLWSPSEGGLPIYDPSDESTPFHIREIGLPILRMDAANPEKNTTRVNFLKGQMQSGRFLIPPYIYYTGEPEIDEVYRSIKKFKQQCSYVVSAPMGNFKKFYVDARYKKDLFSATLLAMQGVYDSFIVEEEVEVCNRYEYI